MTSLTNLYINGNVTPVASLKIATPYLYHSKSSVELFEELDSRTTIGNYIPSMLFIEENVVFISTLPFSIFLAHLKFEAEKVGTDFCNSIKDFFLNLRPYDEPDYTYYGKLWDVIKARDLTEDEDKQYDLESDSVLFGLNLQDIMEELDNKIVPVKFPEIIPYLYLSTIKSEPIFYYLYGIPSVGDIIPAFKFTHKPDGYCDIVFVSTLPYNTLVPFLMYKITTANGTVAKNKKHFIGFMENLVPYDVESYTKELLNELVEYDAVTPRDLTSEEKEKYSTSPASANYALCEYDLSSIDHKEVESDIKSDISKSKEKETLPKSDSVVTTQTKKSKSKQTSSSSSKTKQTSSSSSKSKTEVEEESDLCGAMTTKKTPCKLKKKTCRYHGENKK